MAEDVPGLVSEAEKYSGMDSQIVVKVPMNETGLKAAKILESKGIRVNVTMVFTAVQASLGMLSGASFVSIVLSRLDAIGSDSHQLITDTMLIKKNYNFGTEIIAASLKTYNQVINCLGAGVDIISVPPALFEQIFRHPLTEAGLDGFKKDWMKVIN